MSDAVWVGWFVTWTLFAAWVVFLNGADWLEENWFVAGAIDWLTATWTAEQIRVYFGLGWFPTAAWFVVGLVDPEARWFWF